MMDKKTSYLRGYLLIFGLLNIFVISFTIPLLFGDWLLWEPRNLAVEMMMSSIYLAMGIVMMIIAIAASAAFMSPVGHPANVLVMGPGGYRFSDYLKVGIPLTIVVLIITLIILPVFWPL